jgi:hypothetical protein
LPGYPGSDGAFPAARPPLRFRERFDGPGPITSKAANLARVLRLYFRTRWPLKGSSLKMLLFLEPLAWAFITAPAESAELYVSLCRAES